ncbi:alkylmercury lyase family protein [Tenggerimyces flavus]|uniref:Alkylmercury lyase family protein n=1 Tax=Tenggerimyces flavus TaxID=1708749 RepID=A0ABV7Y9Z0_9ACTN|nr:alkylmercury lyase family protein [Tenggerimyces flavus]MBM7785619.1 hypothetical protein [Tenggerimyces flavus]
MRIEVLHVPDCPLVASLLARLGEVSDEPVVLRSITTEAEAEAYGMAGSPTLLVDGVDPFGLAPPSLTCRFGPLPTVEQLRSALTLGLGLGKASAAAVLSPPARQAHQAILRWFVDHGSAPSLAELASPTVVDELTARDLIALSASGELRAAYPFSPTPTRHRVALDDGPELYSMCAIDALGTSAMLSRPLTIRSTEPSTEVPIEIRVDGSSAEWNPSSAVVFAGTSGDSCCQASVDKTCGSINFFTSPAAARSWSEQQPGTILSQHEALLCGIAEFGPLLLHTNLDPQT